MPPPWVGQIITCFKRLWRQHVEKFESKCAPCRQLEARARRVISAGRKVQPQEKVPWQAFLLPQEGRAPIWRRRENSNMDTVLGFRIYEKATLNGHTVSYIKYYSTTPNMCGYMGVALYGCNHSSLSNPITVRLQSHAPLFKT